MLDVQGEAKVSVFTTDIPTGPRAECFADFVSGEMDWGRREEMHNCMFDTWHRSTYLGGWGCLKLNLCPFKFAWCIKSAPLCKCSGQATSRAAGLVRRTYRNLRDCSQLYHPTIFLVRSKYCSSTRFPSLWGLKSQFITLWCLLHCCIVSSVWVKTAMFTHFKLFFPYVNEHTWEKPGQWKMEPQCCML